MRESAGTTPRPGFFADPIWPIVILFVPLPLWWVLGVWQLMFFLMAIPMSVYLVKQRTIEMPRGFWLWLVWLTWLLAGILVVQAEAPGTVPDISMGRYFVFAYRYAWYLVATVVALYVINTRRVLSTQRLVGAVSWFFVMLVGGGLLGILTPNIDFDSVLQSMLPYRLATHPFVHDLVHAQVAQMQHVLGSPEPRPSAPFIYTNPWGFSVALTLPLFASAWWIRGGWWRVGMVVVLGVAAVPVVLSLNRGTWVAILATVALSAIYLVMRGNVRVIVVGAIGLLLGLALIAFSPLGETISARLDNGHSDQGRGNLAEITVQSTLEGSPIVGFGTTRNVSGNFNSIAGGASDGCPGCEPPPVGTHGQLWITIFGSGFVGAVLYVGFISGQFLRNVRAHSPYARAALASVLTLIVTLPVYGAVGVPLYIGFIAIGILARESRLPLSSLQESVRPVLRNAPALTLCIGIGALIGFGLNIGLGVPVTATQRVLVPAAELSPVPGVRTSTLDAEAMLVRSEPVLDSIAEELDIPASTANARLSVGAEPNTRVLSITFRASSVDDARRGAEAATEAFLSERELLQASNGGAVTQRYTALQSELDSIYRVVRPYADSAASPYLWGTVRSISRQWADASLVLAGVEDPTQARALSSAEISIKSDRRTVRVTSGLALGGLLGLPLILIFDRRYMRLGRRPERYTGLGIPVVARLLDEEFSGIVQAANGYMPLAGIVADTGSARAVRLASRMDKAISVGEYSGTRTLVIVDHATRAYRAQRMIERMRSAGLNPVGIILCGSQSRTLRTKERPRGVRR